MSWTSDVLFAASMRHGPICTKFSCNGTVGRRAVSPCKTFSMAWTRSDSRRHLTRRLRCIPWPLRQTATQICHFKSSLICSSVQTKISLQTWKKLQQRINRRKLRSWRTCVPTKPRKQSILQLWHPSLLKSSANAINGVKFSKTILQTSRGTCWWAMMIALI